MKKVKFKDEGMNDSLLRRIQEGENTEEVCGCCIFFDFFSIFF